MMSQRMRIVRRALLTFFAVFALVPTVRGDYLTQTVELNLSNTLADGVVYGTVKVEAYDFGLGGGGLNPGEVRLTFTANPDPYASTGKNFGFHAIGFNTDLDLSTALISAPDGWKLDNSATLSEFGQFTWKAQTANNTTPVLSLLIQSLGANATLDHFLLDSSSKSGNAVFFAAHVIDFTVDGDAATSHWIGGSKLASQGPPPPEGGGEVPEIPEVPEPTTLALCGFGLGGLALARWVKRRRRV